jgi:hypothetical protein
VGGPIVLLNQRICDLNLDLRSSPLYSRIEKLYAALRSRRLSFRPPCYFADEWFVPEGDPVIGIPFYLATRPLRRMERENTGVVEGDSKSDFMKLLRHEAGHAICYAFQLHRRAAYRATFGRSSKPFSDNYRFDARSKNFVINLDDHYAQSHPDEDFAETFAVWLQMTEKAWRSRYRNWDCLRKLMVVDGMMKSIAARRPLVRTGEYMCHVKTLAYTLKTYYRRRNAFLARHSRSDNA